VLALQHVISELMQAWETWKEALQRWLEVVSSYIFVENLYYSTKVNCFE
jgi:phage anti-repressor protein